MTTYLMAMYGALMAMCVVAGLFFLRYWRLSRDRFFVWFACAFWTFGLNWGLLAYDFGVAEHTHHIYAIRLAGFLQILAAILLKNRVCARADDETPGRPPPNSPSRPSHLPSPRRPMIDAAWRRLSSRRML